MLAVTNIRKKMDSCGWSPVKRVEKLVEYVKKTILLLCCGLAKVIDSGAAEVLWLGHKYTIYNIKVS